ncbi:uncharacterized protein B0H18DRAFT_1081018 [Fomitopsis serialis]|uniref:uncharacterized protein n=1 Tax=Fomitopsis serialis TaxID=139415 RepID=UPI0020076D44|nr:uncharacterized protein B0H18DRAFT_1081018 [Neoantrodia serialis]KAH9938290.1 hypothetical protein B0H18DRAFT_1081018 [Neoantrodia serialis]
MERFGTHDLLRAGGTLLGSLPSEAPSNVADVLKQRLTQYYATVGREFPTMDETLEVLQLQTALEALIGSRDLIQIRTLVSIVFRWGVEPQLGRVANAIPVKNVPKSQVHAGAKIIDLTDVPDDYERLSETVSRLLRLSFSKDAQSSLLQTAVTSALLNKHLADLLKPSIVLGWLPKNLATDTVKPIDSVRPAVMQLLAILPAAQTIAAFGSILSDNSITLPIRQLLRPEGVAGLLTAMFGEEDVSGEDAPLEKLEHVARLLDTVPASMKPEDYYTSVPPTYRRAIAFALSRMLASEEIKKTTTSPQAPGAAPEPTPSEALDILQTLLTNADPSPTFISSLLTPIATKVSDPALKESVRGFLVTWGRVVSASEGIDALWEVVLGEGGEWKADVAGNLARSEMYESGELDTDANLFDLRPDPAQFVRYLKSIERSDVSSELFVRLLEAYREMKAQSASDPLQTLLYLQLILQMQTQLATDDSASSILNKPDHILSFIKHALESAVRKPREWQGLHLEDLRIVEEEENEVPNRRGAPRSICQNRPELNDIFSLLEPLSKDSSDTIRPLAREARMVMTARLASASAQSSSRKSRKSSGDEETPQETYQKALNSCKIPSVQDDDSYMYLNAVQGLSAMVDGYGKEVLRGLVRTYCEGTEGVGKGDHDAAGSGHAHAGGEALGQVVRRCGDALPAYVDILVPPLFRVARTSDLPTTLRTSAISLLALCAKTNSLALLPYAADLAEAMVDLLQVETVPATQGQRRTGDEKEGDTPPPYTPDTMDAQPTRAALHFMTLLIQACATRLYDSDAGVTGSAH